MDRISDSGSDDWGSTPHGRTMIIKTKATDKLIRRLELLCWYYTKYLSDAIAVYLIFPRARLRKYIQKYSVMNLLD